MALNTLDFIIILAAALAAVAGWRAGIAARLVGWVGIGLGLVVGLRLVPVVTKWFDPDEQGLQFAVAAAVVVLGAMVGQSIGQVLGSKLHTVMPAGPWKVADRSAGVLASLALVVVGVWFSADPLKHSVGWPASQARESVLVASVSDALPKPPDVVAEIRETMAGRFPEVFSGAAPEIELGTAPTSVDMTNATRARVLRSVVKVEGPACGHLSQGSGFVVRAGLVMTNAHVVAGMTEPVVAVPNTVGGLSRVAARVVLFDSDLDIALLRIADTSIEPLPLGDGESGDEVGVFGHPRESRLFVSLRLVLPASSMLWARTSTVYARRPGASSCSPPTWSRATRAPRWSIARARLWAWRLQYPTRPTVRPTRSPRWGSRRPSLAMTTTIRPW